MHQEDEDRSFTVGALARVEGEGGLTVKMKGGQVADVQLRIFEPPRFFEAFLRDRQFTEAPDITARICGICPVAYQMSASHAMENACGVTVGGVLRELRRMLYCGEWIESHTLHVYMLHAPDFLGYDSGIHMAKDFPEIVDRGLRLKKIGNALMTLLGGRSVHPVNVQLGGFYRVPTHSEMMALKPDLEWAREAALQTVQWVAGFEFPDFEEDYTFVSLRHASEYPINEGRIVSNKGLDIGISEYEQHFSEEHVAHSTALHSRIDGNKLYFVGPMARYNLNFDRLPDAVQKAAEAAGLRQQCQNPFQGIIIRSLEILYACEESLRIIDNYKPPESPSVAVPPKAATGHGCTEAPRGLLYHRYRIDESGKIQEAKIVPPTSQNQRIIEDDLYRLIPKFIDLPQDRLKHRCEQAIRNYDPCISCSTHFLDLKIEEED